jgi:hypothetical protein
MLVLVLGALLLVAFGAKPPPGQQTEALMSLTKHVFLAGKRMLWSASDSSSVQAGVCRWRSKSDGYAILVNASAIPPDVPRWKLYDTGTP